MFFFKKSEFNIHNTVCPGYDNKLPKMYSFQYIYILCSLTWQIHHILLVIFYANNFFNQYCIIMFLFI